MIDSSLRMLCCTDVSPRGMFVDVSRRKICKGGDSQYSRESRREPKSPTSLHLPNAYYPQNGAAQTSYLHSQDIPHVHRSKITWMPHHSSRYGLLSSHAIWEIRVPPRAPDSCLIHSTKPSSLAAEITVDIPHQCRRKLESISHRVKSSCARPASLT